MLTTALTAMLLFATEHADVGGRGGNPSEGTGARRRSLERHPDTDGRLGRVGSARRD